MTTENKPAAPAAPASIDTPEFQRLLEFHRLSSNFTLQSNFHGKIVAHIDAWGQQQREAGFRDGMATCTELVKRDSAKLVARAEDAEASLARLVAGVEEVLRPYGIYDIGVFHAGAVQADFIATGNKLRAALLPAKAGLKTNGGQDDGMGDTDSAVEPNRLSGGKVVPAPAMGEELPPRPPLPETRYNGCGDGSEPLYTPDIMDAYALDYARACMALRQPGAEKDMSNTDIPQGDARGTVLEQLYAAWHREPCGDTLHAIGCAIQELQARIDPVMELRIVQLANQYLTSADYIWQGDIDQIMAFSGAVAAATAPVSQPAGQEGDWLNLIVRDIAELDYSSDTVLDMLQVSEADLRAIVTRYTAPQPLPAPAGSEQEGGAAVNTGLNVVARLYTQGRYRRASVMPGAGRELVLKSDADAIIAELRAALAAQQESGAK